MWHHDLERVPENLEWVNIGYGCKVVLNHFCDMVDLMIANSHTSLVQNSITLDDLFLH